MKKQETLYPRIFAGLLLAVFIKVLLPETNGLTTVGVNVISVFALIVFWWIFVGVDWVSLLAIGLLPLTGVMSYSAVISCSWGNYIVLFLLATTCLNYALMETGFINRILVWFISRRILLGKPWLFLSIYGLSVYLVSTILSYTNIAAIVFPIAVALCKELNYGENDKFSKCLFILSMWASLLGYSASPVGHSIIVIIMGIIGTYTDTNISFFQWFAVAVPTTLLLMVVTLLVCRFVINPSVDHFIHYDIESKRKSLSPLSKREIAAVGIFGATILCFILPDLLVSLAPAFAGKIQSYGLTTPALIGVALMVLTSIEGKPLLNFRSAIQNMPWHTIFLAAGQCALSAAITAEPTGIVQWMHHLVAPITETAFFSSWIGLALIAAGLTAIITNFLSGVVTMNILFTILLPLALSNGSTAMAVGIGMIIGVVTNLGVMTPPASLGASVFLSSEYLRVQEGFRYGLLFCAASILAGVFVVYPLSLLFI